MVVSSNALFHFTKEINFLESILENNFYPRCCIEDLGFLLPNYEGNNVNVGIPMVCFCDIPLSRISNHINDYGCYGIGLTKQWGVDSGINPIHYIQKNTLAHKHILMLEKTLANVVKSLDGLDKNLKFLREVKEVYLEIPNLPTDIFSSFWEFAAFLKIYEGINNKKLSESKVFYDEREWRFVPNIIDNDINGYTYRLMGEQCKNSELREELNKTLSKKTQLKFKANHVKYLILKNENEITDFVKFIDDLPETRFTLDEKNLLKTKIITVDNIKEDF